MYLHLTEENLHLSEDFLQLSEDSADSAVVSEHKLKRKLKRKKACHMLSPGSNGNIFTIIYNNYFILDIFYHFMIKFYYIRINRRCIGF